LKFHYHPVIAGYAQELATMNAETALSDTKVLDRPRSTPVELFRAYDPHVGEFKPQMQQPRQHPYVNKIKKSKGKKPRVLFIRPSADFPPTRFFTTEIRPLMEAQDNDNSDDVNNTVGEDDAPSFNTFFSTTMEIQNNRKSYLLKGQLAKLQRVISLFKDKQGNKKSNRQQTSNKNNNNNKRKRKRNNTSK